MGRIERSFRFLGVLGEALPWAQGLFQLTHFVTAGCDARCGHCFYAVNRRRRELSIEEIRRVAGSIPRLRFLLISGGEPFLRNDLPAIIEAYFRATSFVNCSIPTNGLRTEAVLDAVRQICRISPDLSLSLSVSLDGFRELHDALRGVQGIFPRALATLAGAIRLKADFPNLHVGVVTTLMRENLAEIGRLIEFVRHEVGPDSHTLNAWRGSGPGMRPPGVTPSDYLALNRTLAALYAGAGRSLKRRMRDAANELR
ncbi:MAG: radical SAM protein [Candidatus Aureabacteria bacterium]|nr:radical SAM protein [Candidatus Auribacterota bacterium]